MPVDEQRTLVLRAARRVFATSGLEAGTIEQIAREAGVSRQAVYELFGDKQSLFRAVVADAEQEAYEALTLEVLEPAEHDLVSVARRNYARLFSFVAENPDVYVVLQEAERRCEPALTRLRERLSPVYAEASRQRWAAHGISSGRADQALVAMYFAMTEALVALSQQEEGPDRDALIELLTQFTVGGVARVFRRHPEIIQRLR